MAQGFVMMLSDAGWMATGAFLSLGLIALAERLRAWRAERATSEWDPY